MLQLVAAPDQGDLWSFSQALPRPGSEREACVTPVLLSLLEEVGDLHNRGLAHGNLSLENVLVHGSAGGALPCDNPKVKLVRFALQTGRQSASAPHEDGAETPPRPKGAPMYVAPEAHGGTADYDARRADLFACGVIAYSLMIGQYPFMSTAGGDKAFCYLQQHGPLALLERRKCPAGPSGQKVHVIDCMSWKLASVIVQLLSLTPSDRSGAVDALLNA